MLIRDRGRKEKKKKPLSLEKKRHTERKMIFERIKENNRSKE